MTLFSDETKLSYTNKMKTVDVCLRTESTYDADPLMETDPVICKVVADLFNIVDEFNRAVPQPSKEELIEHLKQVKDYVESNFGSYSKLVSDIDVLLNNINEGTTCMSEYYDDLLKLRSWINWKY